MAVTTIDDLYRDYDIDGDPASGPHHPFKDDIRDTLKKLLEGISTFPDNRVIRLNNANAGSANNIVVTASVAIPSAAYQVLYILNVTQVNTGSVTVSGAINRALVTNTSRAVPAGYLSPGMAVLCIDTGATLRMLSYGDMEVLIRAAESEVEKAAVERIQAEVARAAAEAARDVAAGYASDAVSQGSVPIYGTVVGLSSIAIPEGINAIRLNGFGSANDGRGGLYVKAENGYPVGSKRRSLDGSWWAQVRDVSYSRLQGDKLQLLPVYPIDEQPVIARWDFSKAAIGQVTAFRASSMHPSAVVGVLSQVNGANTRGVQRAKHPYGTTPVGGTDPFHENSLHIGFDSLTETLNANSMGYQFSVTAPSDKIVSFQDMRLDIGYDSQLATWYDVKAQIYLSDDGSTWVPYGSNISLGDKSAFYSEFTAEDAGGGYFFKNDNPVALSDGNRTVFIQPGLTKYFRIALARSAGVSSSNRRRLVLNNIQLDGTVSDVAITALHGIVSREVGWFYGWVANGARLQRGQRIQISSEKGVYSDNPDGHDIDYSTDFVIFHTTEDDGLTWVDSIKPNVLIPADVTSTIPREAKDFSHPDFGMMLRDNYCWWTYDAGETWIGPSIISGQTTWDFYARTSWMATGPSSALMFMTGSRRSPSAGQSTRNRSFVYSTIDGGLTWQSVGLIGNEDFFNSVASQYSAYSIMPVAVCTAPNQYIVAVRELWRTHKWIAIYSTDDNFKTTKLIARVGQDAENPPAMVQLANGDIWLMYCNRQNGPKGLVAQVSKDGGYSWSVPVYLRTDGVDWDCGYPSAFVRTDGRILVCYYWHTAEMPQQYIARTIFDPAELNPTIAPEYSGPQRDYTFLNRV